MQNRRALTLLLAANAVSGFAQGISMLAIPWYFTHTLKQESAFGIMYAVVTLGSMLWTLYAGTLIDRYPRKRVFQSINVCGALVLGGVAATGYVTGDVPALLVMLVFAATIFIYGIHYPSLYAFGQEITEKKYYGKINSYLEIQGQATMMLAGAVGAVLINGTDGNHFNFMGIDLQLPFVIERWSLQDIFLMDACTYLLAIALISAIRYTPAVHNVVHTGSVWRRLRMGFDYLRAHPLLFLFGNMSYTIFVFLLIMAHLLQAWYVNNHLQRGADVYASLEIFYTIGALFSGFFIRHLTAGKSKVQAVILMMLVTVAGLVVTGLTRSVAVFFIFSLLIGVTNAGTRIVRTTYLFEHVPNNMMGRTNSVFNVINIGMRLLFILLFSIPFFSQGSNVTWTFLIGAVFIGACAVPLILKRKEME